MLGLVVEMAGGEPFEAYLKAHIFEPLRVHQTYTAVEDAGRDGGWRPATRRVLPSRQRARRSRWHGPGTTREVGRCSAVQRRHARRRPAGTAGDRGKRDRDGGRRDNAGYRYRRLLRQALPLLREFGVPAAIIVPRSRPGLREDGEAHGGTGSFRHRSVCLAGAHVLLSGLVPEPRADWETRPAS